MSVLEDIARRQQEKVQRIDAAFAIVMALAPDERDAVMLRLVTALETSAAPGAPVEPSTPATVAVVSPTTATEPPPAAWTEGTFTERAAAYIQAHPEGVKTADVAKAIGQDTKNVDGTLRILVTRGVIERRDGKWWPKAQKPAKTTEPAKKITIRDVITQVLTEQGNAPMTSAAIFAGCHAINPKLGRPSVEGEINRMKKDELLVSAGSNGRAGLYALANADGGEHAA